MPLPRGLGAASQAWVLRPRGAATGWTRRRGKAANAGERRQVVFVAGEAGMGKTDPRRRDRPQQPRVRRRGPLRTLRPGHGHPLPALRGGPGSLRGERRRSGPAGPRRPPRSKPRAPAARPAAEAPRAHRPGRRPRYRPLPPVCRGERAAHRDGRAGTGPARARRPPVGRPTDPEPAPAPGGRLGRPPPARRRQLPPVRPLGRSRPDRRPRPAAPPARRATPRPDGSRRRGHRGLHGAGGRPRARPDGGGPGPRRTSRDQRQPVLPRRAAAPPAGHGVRVRGGRPLAGPW